MEFGEIFPRVSRIIQRSFGLTPYASSQVVFLACSRHKLDEEQQKNMSAPQNIVAVIFDFDDTLTDESTTKLLEEYGIAPVEFWKTQNEVLIAKHGWDPVPGYLKLMLDNVGPDKPFGKLKNSDLRAFGSTLKFYPGVARLFTSLRKLASEHRASNPHIEFYVITSGLEEIVRGSKIAKELSGVWGCQFAEAGGMIAHIKNVVSFTEKTRHLFEINKGINDKRKKPYAVNEDVKLGDRRIPFSNMIYVGDGLTDVPCFSLVSKLGGRSVGVFDPSKAGSPKRAFEKLIAPQRVMSIHSPKYGPNDDLGSFLRVVVNQICVDLDVRSGMAL